MGECKFSCHFTTLGKEKQVMKLNSFGDSHTKRYIVTRYYATN